MLIANCLKFKSWIHKNFVGRLQGHEKSAYFLCNGGSKKNGHFSVFFYLLKNRLKYGIFFQKSWTHQKKNMIFEHNFWKFHQNLKLHILLNKIFMTLSSNWKVKGFTTSLIKRWWYEFLSIIDLTGRLKSLLLDPQTIFGLEGIRKGCKVAANIL